MEYHTSGTLPLLGSPRYCAGANSASGYLCQTGQCCQETGCCTYYYELWWFWLLWSVLILFSCCCAYRHRQAKQRVQQQQRQREINLMAYHGACSYPSSMFDLSFLASLKLPSYEEVAAQPSTPPPPYSSVAYPRGSAHPGPSHMLSSQSSDNYTSCSCDSCCPSSPCSSSPSSAQLTDETDTSHASTPSVGEPRRGCIAAVVTHAETASVVPVDDRSRSTAVIEAELTVSTPLDCNGNQTMITVSNEPNETCDAAHGSRDDVCDAASQNITRPTVPVTPPSPPTSSSLHLFSISDPLGVQQHPAMRREEPAQDTPPPQSPPRSVVFSPGVEPERRDSAVSDLDVDQTHFQQRRLTGDSGIEVCRCRVEEDDEEEGEPRAEMTTSDGLHDSPDCSERASREAGGKMAWPVSETPLEAVVIAMETD
ncbi:uncharacterized protein si:ch73-290k24.6 [Triplophysa rosa]|uniref:WW domain-binding protein 1 n=1 Tax=Triplophysa rosa TaxID=992332 RepID=A0A9W7WEB7_TRIRA|nr:uncharacterized protein si:ch73-290k24.6 [Triplophysa rosa]KAI7794673.1 hypothetical protein IRJ41_020543 [Triplophysa rosa]